MRDIIVRQGNAFSSYQQQWNRSLADLLMICHSHIQLKRAKFKAKIVRNFSISENILHKSPFYYYWTPPVKFKYSPINNKTTTYTIQRPLIYYMCQYIKLLRCNKSIRCCCWFYYQLNFIRSTEPQTKSPTTINTLKSMTLNSLYSSFCFADKTFGNRVSFSSLKSGGTTT